MQARPFWTSIIVGRLAMSKFKHFSHSNLNSPGTSDIPDFFIFTETLHNLVWCQPWPQWKLTIERNNTTKCKYITWWAYISFIAFNCSGDWYPGEPACAVFIPMNDVFTIASNRPKSVNVAWSVIESTCNNVVHQSIIIVNCMQSSI